ncbi:hypothetical protein I4U23_021623 [Adineta vaga]|nr:hypothetical protein I4U23_021623 [Adineta vaga]
MSQRCMIALCRESSKVLCYCCNQNLCLEHLSNHKNSNSLIDQVKLLNEEMKRFDIEKFIEHDRRRLTKWRDECFKKISRYYERKCDELEEFYQRKFHEEQKQIDSIQRKLIYLNQYQNTIEDEDFHQFPTIISNTKQKIHNIEQNGIPIHIRSLSIDENFITIGELKFQEFNLNDLSLPYQTLNISKTSTYGITNNEQYLLIDQNSNITLIDRNLRMIEQFTWKHGIIRDMCWSFALRSFLLITEMNKAYLLNEINHSIDCIEPMINQLWISCTCSNSLLYLVSLNNAIVEFSLLPTFISNRRWDQPDTCKKHETIKDISSSDDLLALIVTSEKTQMIHLILRSLATFDEIFSIRLDIIIHPSYHLPMRCCLLKNDQWLVCDANTSRLFHIGKNGKIKGTFKYDQQPFNLVVFDDSKILAIRTENTINFHHLF